MIRKWFIPVLMAGLLLAGAFVNNANAAERKIVMRIGTVTVMPAPQSFAAETFKRLVEEKVGDRLEVQVFHASQLGTIPQHLQGLQNGSVHGIFMPCGFQSLLVPEIGVLDLPFFFPSAEWAYKMFNLGYVEPLSEAMRQKGLRLISSPPCPMREVFLTRPISSIDEFKGMRIRTYSSPINQQALAAWGFTPVNIDSADISVAIEQGTVDGIETDVTFWYGQKLFRANYRLDAHGGSIVHMMTVSDRWFSKLPEDIQQAIIEAGQAVPPIVQDHIKNVMEPRIEADKEANLIPLAVSDELRAALRERSVRMHGVYTNQGASFQKTYDYYKALIEQYPNADAPMLR